MGMMDLFNASAEADKIFELYERWQLTQHLVVTAARKASENFNDKNQLLELATALDLEEKARAEFSAKYLGDK